MKTKTTIILLLLTFLTCKADDFSVVNTEGITIGYTIGSLANFTVSVTSVDFGVKSKWTNVVIPDTVEYKSHKFAVTTIKSVRGVKSITLTTTKGIYTSAFDPGVNIYIPDLDFWRDLPVSRGYGGESYYDDDRYESRTGISCNLYVNGHLLKDLVIPDTWMEVPPYLFSECESIETVTLPESVTTIREGAFRLCPNLKNISFDNNLTYIYHRAFEGCDKLEAAIVPNFVQLIDIFAFSECKKLKHITLGNSLKEVKACVFENCISLESIDFGNSIEYIRERAFYGCKALAAIDIPNSVIEIEQHAFDGCAKITSATFGEGLKEIGASVIVGWESIQSVTCKSQTPPKVSSSNNYISNKLLLDAVLNVPKGTTEAYKKAFLWSWFINVNTIGGTPDDIHYKVSVIAGKGGCVASDGQSVSDGQMLVRYDKDAGVVLTITPDKGYRISAVKVNGTDVTKDVKDGKYTLEALDGDTSVTVAFEAMVYERDDVNEDGEVNTADVTHIYNRIIYGKDYEE